MAEVYVGCFLPGVTESLNAEWHSLGPTDDCLAICRSENRVYTYQLDALATGGVTFTRRCACTDKAPDYRHMAGEICHPDAIDLYGVWKAHSTWSYDACYRSPGSPGGSAQQIDNIEDCFSMCSDSRYATLSLTRVGSEAEGYCTCYNTADPWNDLPLSGCAYGDWYVYTRSTTPSGFVKRHRSSGEKDREEYCPAGLTACNIPGLREEDHECIDISMDPESCGGCLHGEFRRQKSSTGVDCTALPGKLPSDISCHHGKCIASICETDFRLREGGCVSISSE
ncbi:hypothetical protein V866_008555 [Kwoniella sp. B9012]